jgi:hypothetical protein
MGPPTARPIEPRIHKVTPITNSRTPTVSRMGMPTTSPTTTERDCEYDHEEPSDVHGQPRQGWQR